MRDLTVDSSPVSPHGRHLAERLAHLRSSLPAALHAAGDIPLPRWTTPLTVGTLAMLVVQSFDHRYIRGSLGWSLLVLGALATLLAALYAALSNPRTNGEVVQARTRRITSVLLVFLVANTFIQAVQLVPRLTQTNRYSTDAAAATDCATQMVRQGRNPYANVHMLVCLHNHGLAFNQTTPKRAGALKPFMTFPSPNSLVVMYYMWKVYGEDLTQELQDQRLADRTGAPYRYAAPEFEERFNYPGGALLFSLVAWTFGLRDLVALFLVCTVAASLLIYNRADPRIKLATGALLLADLPLLNDSVGGVTDVLYALILVIYWQCRERALAAGLLLGLAVATRQQAWFFAPFLLYLGWRTAGWRDLRWRASAMALVFLACNAPWIAQSPSDWLRGVLGPMSDPLFAQGVGLVSVSVALFKQHLVSPLPYTLLEGLALVAAFRLFTRRCLSAPGLAMLLPLIPIALAWRSLHTYFVVLPLLAIAVLACPPVAIEADQPAATDLHAASEAP